MSPTLLFKVCLLLIVVHIVAFIVFAGAFETDRDGISSHIRVMPAGSIPPYTVFNWDAYGNLTKVSGFVPQYLNLIAQRFRLTYSWIPLSGKQPVIEDTPTQKGLITYLKEDEGDVVVGVVLVTAARYRYVDYSHAVSESQMVIVIPKPASAIDSRALVKPFTLEVWIGVMLCVLAVILSWHGINLMSDMVDKMRRSKRTNDQVKRETVYVPMEYTLTVLLTQGNGTSTSRLAVRLIAGAWCLATFVLVPAYSGTLTSFLTSPIARPIVESYHDITNRVSSGMKVAVEEDLGIDMHLKLWANLTASGAMNTSIGKMAFAVRNSIYRCPKIEMCIEKVTDGDHVAITAENQALQLILEDFVRTGTCRLSLAKETFTRGYASWMLQKKSPYLELINRGILEADAFGLSNYWKKHYTPRPTPCLKSGVKSMTQSKKISLAYMSSTFVVFLVGCGLSVFAFLCELVATKMSRYKTSSFHQRRATRTTAPIITQQQSLESSTTTLRPED